MMSRGHFGGREGLFRGGDGMVQAPESVGLGRAGLRSIKIPVDLIVGDSAPVK